MQRTITITGEGPVLLWTKNALERNGFIIGEGSNTVVKIGNGEWSIGAQSFRSLNDLIIALQ
jgi:hypothetical protein